MQGNFISSILPSVTFRQNSRKGQLSALTGCVKGRIDLASDILSLVYKCKIELIRPKVLRHCTLGKLKPKKSQTGLSCDN